MHPALMKSLLHSSKTSGKLLLECQISQIPGRMVCSLLMENSNDNVTVNLHDSLEALLIKESPLLANVTKWSKNYFNESSEICQKYYKENVMVTLDKAINICNNSVKQSCLEWKMERQKRITGSTCFPLFKYCKLSNPNWERRLEFAYKAKNFPLYLTHAMTHGLSHQKAAQRRYEERMNNCTILDLGLVVHPKLPFLGFSPDGIVLDKYGKPQNLLEIKCPLDGRCFSSQDLLKLAPYVDRNGSIRSNYKYYGQVQLGMFILGLPYCDFILYSSSESDYTKKRIEFDEMFVQEMMGSLVKVYFKEILPWLTKHNLGVSQDKISKHLS